jgi:hypothetical protein
LVPAVLSDTVCTKTFIIFFDTDCKQLTSLRSSIFDSETGVGFDVRLREATSPSLEKTRAEESMRVAHFFSHRQATNRTAPVVLDRHSELDSASPDSVVVWCPFALKKASARATFVL